VAAATGTPRAVTEGEALRRLTSYRYAFKMTADNASPGVSGRFAMDIAGEYVAPDRTHQTVNASVGGLTHAEESITIGSRTWVKQGTVWTEGPASFGNIGLTPTELFSNFKTSDLQGLPNRKERINNVAATRYTFDRATLEALQNFNSIFGTPAGGRSSLPQTISGDIWVADDGGYPVKMTIKMSGLPTGTPVAGAQSAGPSNIDLAYDLLDINSTAIRIEPPR
jgi:hypothetical protein